MELSNLNRYPVKDTMTFDTGDVLEVIWDADFFSRKGVREFERGLNDAISKAREEHLTKLRALEEEVKALDGSKDKKGKKAKESSEDSVESQRKLEELTEQIEGIIESLDEAVHDASVDAYSVTLSEKVLMGWGMTEGGQAVPVSAEVLKTRPLLFLQDLFAFCKERSLPKVEKKRRAAMMIVQPTPNGSSSRISPQPADPTT